MLALSPRGISFPSSEESSFVSLSEGTDSPVREDSSTLRLAVSMSLPSAGIASPASRSTTSPLTISSAGTCLRSPFLYTFAVSPLICFRASMACSALLSWITPRTAFTTTTNSMMKTSMKDSPEYAAVTADITAETSSIIIIGSASCSRNLFIRGTFSASLSLFLPSLSSLFRASPSLRP